MRSAAPFTVRCASCCAAVQYMVANRGRDTSWPLRCTASSMSSPHGWLARRYSSGGGSWAGGLTRACSSAASGMTQGEIVVANDLARNGPSGRDSNAWMSRALQSISSTTPNTCAAKSSIGTGRPGAEPVPTTKPSSASKSSLRVGVRSGRPCPGAIWPCGRATGVPLTTTVPARPW